MVFQTGNARIVSTRDHGRFAAPTLYTLRVSRFNFCRITPFHHRIRYGFRTSRCGRTCRWIFNRSRPRLGGALEIPVPKGASQSATTKYKFIFKVFDLAQIAGGQTCSRECPLSVISGHDGANMRCPLYPQKRTLEGASWMSALCQKRTFHSETARACSLSDWLPQEFVSRPRVRRISAANYLA